MKIHQLTEDQAYASLHSSAQEISEQEALRRLREYGPNRVEEIGKRRFLPSFIKEFTHFFALILWLAAILAFIADWHKPDEGMAMLGYAIVGVILINGVFSFWQNTERKKLSLHCVICCRNKLKSCVMGIFG